jgi:phosphate acetyltransferase
VTTGVYITSFAPASGKSLVALGLVETLVARAGRVGYLRPVAPLPDDGRRDLIASRLGHPEDAVTLVDADELADALGTGEIQGLLQRVITTYEELSDRCDVVVVDGTDHTGVAAAGDVEVDLTIAADLAIPVVAVVNAHGLDRAALDDAVALAQERLSEEGLTTATTVVNRVDDGLITELREAHADDVATVVLRDEPLLSTPTVAEVVAGIGGTPLSTGRGKYTTISKAAPVDDDQPVTGVKVAAMTLPNVLDHLSDGTLLVTPGDRHDIVLGALMAGASPSLPTVSGIVLTGGLRLDPRVLDLLEGFDPTIPIVAVGDDTFATAAAISDVPSVLRAHHHRKVRAALAVFEEAVDGDALADHLIGTVVERVTPRMFEHRLLVRASAHRRRIVLPEGTDRRILEASAILRRRGVADLVLLGDLDEVARAADTAGVTLDGLDVIDPASDPRRQDYAEEYARLREHKGMTVEQGLDRMTDVSYFGTMMVHRGDADGMVSGAAHTTAHTIRPAFEFVRTAPGVDVVSSVFLMALADRVLVYGDCAVIPQPTAEELADIAVASAATARTFGIDPRVAMLSYSTGESGSGSDVEKVRRAVALVRERAPELDVEGPIQYDAAVDAGVAAAKLPGSSVAGRATVFVFPDLDTGNTTYKAVQRSAGAVAIGPILQGLNAPVNDLSRGCLVADIVNTVAITAIQAQVRASGRSS